MLQIYGRERPDTKITCIYFVNLQIRRQNIASERRGGHPRLIGKRLIECGWRIEPQFTADFFQLPVDRGLV